MRIILYLAVCAIASAYTDIDDSINVEELIKDVPTMKNFLDCFLDQGPCTKQTLGYKSHFMEVINDGCKECNDRERHMYRVFIRGLKEDLPQEYKEFRQKYDPDNKHFDAAAAAVENY